MAMSDSMQGSFLKQLVQTAKGRAHLYALIGHAEGSGEGRIFEQLKRRGDPELDRLATRHAADEERHAALMVEAVARTGEPLPEIPATIQVLEHLDAALGGILKRDLETEDDVMRAYVVLQVIEERAMSQFGALQEVLRDVDPTTAEIFGQIAADETRHLRYCHAVAGKYASSPLAYAEALATCRQVEARIYAENAQRTARWFMETGAFRAPLPVRWFWQAMGALNGALKVTRPTPFMDLPPEQILPEALASA